MVPPWHALPLTSGPSAHPVSTHYPSLDSSRGLFAATMRSARPPLSTSTRPWRPRTPALGRHVHVLRSSPFPPPSLTPCGPRAAVLQRRWRQSGGLTWMEMIPHACEGISGVALPPTRLYSRGRTRARRMRSTLGRRPWSRGQGHCRPPPHPPCLPSPSVPNAPRSRDKPALAFREPPGMPRNPGRGSARRASRRTPRPPCEAESPACHRIRSVARGGVCTRTGDRLMIDGAHPSFGDGATGPYFPARGPITRRRVEGGSGDTRIPSVPTGSLEGRGLVRLGWANWVPTRARDLLVFDVFFFVGSSPPPLPRPTSPRG